MKVFSSLKGLVSRNKYSKMIRRRGKIRIINKRFPRFKAVQG
ncbi:50S ribosomal protein L36 [Candidatus Nesciobacter abundans]|uniref:50S ribosomal protein L36 n=1 Tax=Candidatus Nesciobacter abundans TaxID=2601668 RepID=A0A5C0UGT7_9PROT|nr:50S ribosomal protein L36 [Candidatus Nesciobacter abundans]QEK39298.1 50S ribosomal protein L36 [Candidatus Nesciobacter abundans]